MLIGTAVFMFIRTNLSDELNTATISQHKFFKRQNKKKKKAKQEQTNLPASVLQNKVT